MASLQIELLGGFSVRTASGEFCPLPTNKTRALLAYLSLPAGRFHSRQKLTALLWGDSAEGRAQQSFRQALAALRRSLGDGSSGALITEGDGIGLKAAEVSVDAGHFLTAAADRSIAGLERAAALYRGDLLDGLSVDEAPFEEWRLGERERLRELALDVLAKLLRSHVGADRTETSVQIALRILGMDPLQEAVHRTLMRLFVGQGRRSTALRQYQQCAGWLARELGSEPEPETQELYRAILRSSVRVSPRPGNGAATRPDEATAAPSTETPLVGRRAEIETLHTAFDAALESGARTAIVSGESGIGKTRVIQEFAASPRTQVARVLFGWCYASEQPLPLRPWIDALRASLDAETTEGLGAPARVQLARVFPELAASATVTSTTDQYGPLFEAMRELVASLAAKQPTVIVLEDLHWGDAMSVRLIAFLNRRLAGLPLFIVGSVRPEDAVDTPILHQVLTELRNAGASHIALSALDRADSKTLTQALCAHRRNPRLVERMADEVWTLSEGNPFVIVETLRAVEKQTGVRTRPVLARTVRESVARRLSRFPESSRRVLEAAAVIGRSFRFRMLLEVADIDETACATAVDELVRRHVLEAVDERLAFTHERIRQVAYEDLLPRRRVLLHRAVAQALESEYEGRVDDIADELGQHFLRAEDAQKALSYLVRAAEIAAQRYALESALAVLNQAAAAARSLAGPERDRWSLDVSLRRALILTNLGRHNECLELLRSIASLHARIADDAFTSEYFLRLAMTYAYLGVFEETRVAAESSLRSGQRAKRNDCIGKAFYALALGRYGCGAMRDAIAFDRQAIPLLDHVHTRYWLAVTHWNLAACHYSVGDFDGALEHASRCDEIGSLTGDRKLHSLALSIRARVSYSRGDARSSLDLAQRALDASHDPVATVVALRELGNAQLESGDVSAAIATLERVVRPDRQSPAQKLTLWALANLAEAYLLSGAIDKAEAAARQTLDVNAGVNAFHDGLAYRVLGRVALPRSSDGGYRYLMQALDAFTRCEATFEAARTRLDLAVVLVARGDRIGARAHMESAIRGFNASGASRRTAQAMTLARTLGVAVSRVVPMLTAMASLA
jgi:DNA-binding SARP family transcriptional activator/tetratricopeptide (TPR) repeat protein